MTIKEKKNALKEQFNKCAQNYIDSCKEYDKYVVYCNFLKEKHPAEYADKITTLDVKIKELRDIKFINKGKYLATQNCCALMLSEEELDELMFFAPHY